MEDLSQRRGASMAQAAAAGGSRHRDRRHQSGEPRSRADKLFVTTTGIGIVPDGSSHLRVECAPRRCGDSERHDRRSRHGDAVRSAKGMDLEGEILSDTAPLHRLVAAMIAAGEVHVLRDPTRGGLGTSLCEIAAASGVGVQIESRAIPVREEVKGACETAGHRPAVCRQRGQTGCVRAAGERRGGARGDARHCRRPRLVGDRQGRGIARRHGRDEDRHRRHAHRRSPFQRAVTPHLLASYPRVVSHVSFRTAFD